MERQPADGPASTPMPAPQGTTARPAAATPEELKVIPILSDLSSDDLAWIAAQGERIELEPGGILFNLGEPADWMFLTLDGVLQSRREGLGSGAPSFVSRKGDIGGIIPFSRMKEFVGVGRAVTRSVVIRFPKARFGELLRRIPVLQQRFVSHLADRVREATRRDAQFEKFNALGKLSAGLAHELNNPTAATLRVVAEVRRRLADRNAMISALVGAGMSADALRRLDDLARAAIARADESPAPDALARSDREDRLATWLEEAGVAEPWLRASTFVDAGLDEATLRDGVADLPPAARAAALDWLETGLAVQALFDSAEQSGRRITSLLEAMRTYTHRDRTRDMVDVDIREGLASALALCAARIQEKRISLVREFATEIPRIRGFPGDLNQVWSNLLDNAIDAAPSSNGRIVVSAGAEDGMVVAEVEDNGPGIPPAIEPRIFEPFFTTKDVGRGAGLGLDIARRVVTDLHDGEIIVSSTPGKTSFVVRLPLTTISTLGA